MKRTYNVHTHIYRTKECRNTKNTYDFLVQVRNFLLPLNLKVFRYKERLYHLSKLTFPSAPNQVRHLPQGLGERAKVNHLPLRQNSTNWLFSNLSPLFRCVTSLTSQVTFPIWDFYCDISEWHVRSACAWTPALMFAPN